MLLKIPYKDSKDILSRFTLSEVAKDKILATDTPEVALKILMNHGSECLIDLINFIAHSFPPREAICWAINVIYNQELSCNEMIRPQLKQAISKIIHWIEDPRENLRREFESLSNEFGLEISDGWLCLAVFWNGTGSIVEESLPIVLPSPYLYSKAIYGAVGTCAPTEPDKQLIFMDMIYNLCIDVAQGDWPKPLL